jgi:UPF0755 protein
MCAKKKMKKSNRLKYLIIASIILIVSFSLFKIFGPNTGAFHEGDFLYIRTGSTYEEVKKTLINQGFVKEGKSFELLAQKTNYTNKVKAGKYKIKKGMSNYSMIKLLGSGQQEPVRLVINKIRTQDDFIKLISSKLEADSNQLRKMLKDNTFLAQYGLDSSNAMAVIMPNSYDFFWNTNAEAVLKKIAKQYLKFWTNDRKDAAKQKHLTPAEIITIASIVEEETNKKDEKKKVASVYLNRLKKGMKLQADPTAKFAYGDFTIKRITSAHTQLQSPYNTYFVQGLPPGPICTPSENSIDAVLFAGTTDYLYFCAKEDFSGYHNFAATYSDHINNAKKYHAVLNARGIK